MDEAPTTIRRELLIAASWALLVPVVLTVVFSSAQASGRELAWTYVLNFLITLSIGGCVRGAYALIELAPVQRWPRWVHHALALPAGLLVGSEIALLVVGTTMPFANIGGGRWMLWRIGGIVSLLVISLSGLIDSWRGRALASELARAEASRRAVAAQLSAVQARVQPHFLFNALNTVAALVEEDPPQAVGAIERLSSLLRKALERAEDDVVSLRDELGLTSDYVALERLRFESRLDVAFDVDDAALELAVPSFCLQPLVENAVRHGMAGRGTLHVEVRARVHPGQLCLVVEDDGRGHSDNPGTSRGRKDLQARLDLLYGDDASFEAGPRPEGGYRATLRLPASTAEAQ